jgi:hypothetical protein
VPAPVLNVGGADRLEKLEFTAHAAAFATRTESAERRASDAEGQVLVLRRELDMATKSLADAERVAQGLREQVAALQAQVEQEVSHQLALQVLLGDEGARAKALEDKYNELLMKREKTLATFSRTSSTTMPRTSSGGQLERAISGGKDNTGAGMSRNGRNDDFSHTSIVVSMTPSISKVSRTPSFESLPAEECTPAEEGQRAGGAERATAAGDGGAPYDANGGAPYIASTARGSLPQLHQVDRVQVGGDEEGEGRSAEEGPRSFNFASESHEGRGRETKLSQASVKGEVSQRHLEPPSHSPPRRLQSQPRSSGSLASHAAARGGSDGGGFGLGFGFDAPAGGGADGLERMGGGTQGSDVGVVLPVGEHVLVQREVEHEVEDDVEQKVLLEDDVEQEGQKEQKEQKVLQDAMQAKWFAQREEVLGVGGGREEETAPPPAQPPTAAERLPTGACDAEEEACDTASVLRDHSLDTASESQSLGSPLERTSSLIALLPRCYWPEEFVGPEADAQALLGAIDVVQYQHQLEHDCAAAMSAPAPRALPGARQRENIGGVCSEVPPSTPGFSAAPCSVHDRDEAAGVEPDRGLSLDAVAVPVGRGAPVGGGGGWEWREKREKREERESGEGQKEEAGEAGERSEFVPSVMQRRGQRPQSAKRQFDWWPRVEHEVGLFPI